MRSGTCSNARRPLAEVAARQVEVIAQLAQSAGGA